MKILITGGSGLIGQYLNIALSQSHECLTTYHNNVGNCNNFRSVKFDLLEAGNIEYIFSAFQPHVVVHTASISTPILADKFERVFVEKLNVGLTEKLAQLCEKSKCRLIFTSTDLVYDGSVGPYLSEGSKFNPLSLYAETKIKAEQKITETFENYLILRTALHYGFGLNHSSSFFQVMYENLKKGSPVNLFTDQFRSPLELKYSAEIFKSLVEIDEKNMILNYGSRERLSRYDLGVLLCEALGFDKFLLNPVLMSEVDFKYPVADVSMNTENLWDRLNISYKPVDECINESIAVL